MPIVKMKRILLAAPLQDRERLLAALQRMGCVQVTDFDLDQEQLAGLVYPQESQRTSAQADQELARLRWAISKISKYDRKKTSMFSPKPGVQLDQLMPDGQTAQSHEAIVQKIEALERCLGELRGQEARLGAQMEQLSPWLKLDIPLEQLSDTPILKQYIGTLPKAALQTLQESWAGQALYIEDLGVVRENAYLWTAVHASLASDFAEALKQAGFVAASFGHAQGTIRTQHDALRQALITLQQARQEAEEQLASLVSALPELKIYHDAMTGSRARIAAGENLLHTKECFLMRGWLPEPIEDKVLQTLSRDFPDAVAQVSQPGPDDEPPVLLHNNPVVSPFESVVSAFSLPSPSGIDPSAMMMPFFACFFGMMVSDAGYGLVMMLVIPLLIKLMKPTGAGKKLFLVLGIGGLATVVWGALYNSWFGFAPWPTVFDPVNNSIPVMAVCMGLGAVHLFSGLVMGALLHIRRKQYIDVLYDQLSWAMLVVGLGLLVLPAAAQIGKWMAIAGAAIILLFGGRGKGLNPIKRLVSGFGKLYGITGWISDLLSYMRLFGMGLATGVIGMVINQLVGMVIASGPIGWVIGAVVFLGGHLFNAAINILGAYVHACRLQYIEFFGKFYEDGGKPFSPLDQKPRYVRIEDAV